MMCKSNDDSKVFVLSTLILIIVLASDQAVTERTVLTRSTEFASCKSNQKRIYKIHWLRSDDVNVLKYCQNHNNLSWLITWRSEDWTSYLASRELWFDKWEAKFATKNLKKLSYRQLIWFKLKIFFDSHMNHQRNCFSFLESEDQLAVLKFIISTFRTDFSLSDESFCMRVCDDMFRDCKIDAWNDVVFDSLVLRLRDTIDSSHKNNHTCTHSVSNHQLMILVYWESVSAASYILIQQQICRSFTSFLNSQSRSINVYSTWFLIVIIFFKKLSHIIFLVFNLKSS